MKQHNTTRRWWQATLLASTLTTTVWAGTGVTDPDAGLVRGQVTDVEKHALPGATIQIEQLGVRTLSDESGRVLHTVTHTRHYVGSPFAVSM